MMSNSRNSSRAAANIKRDLQMLRNDVTRLSEQISSELSNGSNEGLSKARHRVAHIRRSLDEVMASSRDKAGAVATSLEGSLRNHPLAALAMAIGAGLILGTSWQNRR